MPSQKNVGLLDTYTETLSGTPNFVLTRYTGMTVAQLTDLRKKLLESGYRYQIIKNNIFNLALQNREDLENYPADQLVGPLGGVFSGEDLPAAAKILKEYSKGNDKLVIVSGVFESRFLSDKDVERIAGLPGKSELLATIAATINAPATQIASMMNNVIASLARGIKAVGEKNG